MLVLLSVEDLQFCVAQRDTVRPLTAKQLELLNDNMSQILNAQQHVTSINLVESALTTALLKLRGAFLHNQKVPGTKKTSPPSTAELLKVVVAYMIPFIGFGITDNGLMIIFGEAIEKFLGARRLPCLGKTPKHASDPLNSSEACICWTALGHCADTHANLRFSLTQGLD